MFQVFLSAFPIVLLIFLMSKSNAMPSHKALPLCAFLVYLIMLFPFAQDPVEVDATVVNGLLKSFTPILIIAGAIFLFRTLEVTGSLKIIKAELNQISDNPVAQLMIIGWAFAFLLEGASGFGTPAAIAAPILVGLGYPPLKVAILMLIMNSVPVSFGAVGTPTWFGFSGVDLNTSEQLLIGFRSAVLHGIMGFIIPLIALKQILSWRTIKENLLYIQLSLLCTLLPYVLIARIDYEFPSLIAGSVGMLASLILAKYNVGLKDTKVNAPENTSLNGATEADTNNYTFPTSTKLRVKNIVRASFPIWGTLLLLIITRVPQLGLSTLLTSTSPAVNFPLWVLGEFSVSASLVLSLNGILGTGENWQHALLYVPSILPFLVISVFSMIWSGGTLSLFSGTLKYTYQRMRLPSLALFGALILVSLMMMGGETSAVNHIGKALAQVSGNSWGLLAPFLGALGSFFSGSATISNLTFGAIQNSIALNLGLDKYTILALQSVGGSLGNMVCINNIVAVCTVLGLEKSEGKILRETVLPMCFYGLAAGLLALVLF